MKTKKWWKSKTVWLNVLGIAVTVTNELTGKVVPTSVAVNVLSIINVLNIILRTTNTTALTK